jgi:hypothetical protein
MFAGMYAWYLQLKPGFYGKSQGGKWMFRPPILCGFMPGNFSLLDVTENADGTITVSTPISYAGLTEWWHGYLRNGNWMREFE